MTQSREQFEAHYDGWCSSGFQGYTESMRMGNSYKLPSIARAWAHWRASRDALVIDLPKPAGLGKLCSDMTMAEIREDNRFNRALTLSAAAISSAGIKVSHLT